MQISNPFNGLPLSGDATFQGDTFSIRAMSDPTSPPVISVVSSPGNVPNDDYVYSVCFITNSDDVTLPTGDSNQITIADNTVAGQILITNIVQPTDPSVLFIQLFRNGINVEGAYELVANLPVGTTSYLDNLDTGSLPGGVAPTINTTARLNVDGKAAFNDFSATLALIGTLGSEQTRIDYVGVQTGFMTVSPTASSLGCLQVIPVVSQVDYHQPLFRLLDLHSSNNMDVLFVDEYGNLVSGDTLYAQNTINANIHLKKLHVGCTYAFQIDQLAGRVSVADGIILASSGTSVPGSGGLDSFLALSNSGNPYIYVPNGAAFQVQGNGAESASFGQQLCASLTQAARSGGGSAYLLLATGAAHTNLDASTEKTDVTFNLARTVQFATGALTTQRAFRIQAPTYGFVGASTITNASTFAISGSPVAGTNATLTNSYALNIESGTSKFSGRIQGASASVASANNLTLGAANQNIVSGTTQVNAITTAGWLAGAEVTLIFSGALTVKHNTAGGAGTAKIFLSGSTDLVTAANTVLRLEYDGTQWQELSRKAA